MAGSTGPVLAATAISFGNEWLGNGQLDLKILVAGGIAAGGLALLGHVPGLDGFATGIAWVALLTTFLISPKGGRSPVANIQRLTGL